MHQNRLNGQFKTIKDMLEDLREKKLPKTALERKQSLLEHYCRMMLQSDSIYGLMCYGSGGNGKTTVIHRAVERETGSPPVVCNSHLTPLGLFLLLWRFQSGHVLLLEDCEQALGAINVGLLRSALFSINGDRLVTYNTSSNLDVPTSFHFNSKIIILANSLPKGEAFKALQSRCIVYHLSPSREEVLEQFRRSTINGFTCPSGYNIPKDLALEVIDLLERKTQARLSMRHLSLVMITLEYALNQHLPYEDLILNQLQNMSLVETVPSTANKKEKLLALVGEAMKTLPNQPKRQEEWWCEQTGKSKATWYRYRAKWEAR